MRIFTAVRHSIDPRFCYGGLWSANFYPALKQLGHEIVESQVDLLPCSRFMQIASDFTDLELEARAQTTQKIIDELARAHSERPIDLFLSYFYNSHFDPVAFDEIHRLGIPTVNFYCNSTYQFELVAQIAPRVNYAWHSEKAAADLYRKINANPVWVQMGADPAVYHPVPHKVKQPKACFVGQRYADRDRWISALLTSSVPIDIYGGGWGAATEPGNAEKNGEQQESIYLGRKYFAPGSVASYAQASWQNVKRLGVLAGAQRNLRQLTYKSKSHSTNGALASSVKGFASDLSETFAEYEVVLNFSNVWADGRPGSSLVPHVRLRDFEAPMSRTCFLTGATEEIAEFYEVGKEIDTYHALEELVEKTKFYLARPAEAERLREAGYRRALRDHTWKNRFEELFSKIDLTT